MEPSAANGQNSSHNEVEIITDMDDIRKVRSDIKRRHTAAHRRVVKDHEDQLSKGSQSKF